MKIGDLIIMGASPVSGHGQYDHLLPDTVNMRSDPENIKEFRVAIRYAYRQAADHMTACLNTNPKPRRWLVRHVGPMRLKLRFFGRGNRRGRVMKSTIDVWPDTPAQEIIKRAQNNAHIDNSL